MQQFMYYTWRLDQEKTTLSFKIEKTGVVVITFLRDLFFETTHFY